MKRILMVIGLLVMAWWLFVWIGEYAIRRSHTVGQYSFSLPASETVEVTDAVILDGMKLALQRFGLEPSAWAVSDYSSWQPTNAAGVMAAHITNLVILASNKIDGTRLFVRVQPSVRADSLEYLLSRSK